MSTPLDLTYTKRAYNLGLKAVSNFLFLSEKEIEYYEKHLDELPDAIVRGFVLPPEERLVDSDFIVHVTRSTKPIYPKWIKEIIHPEFEIRGPVEYDLRKLKYQFHDNQMFDNVVHGHIIYGYLKARNVLANCLNLQDGLAIREMGIAVFKRLFKGKVICLWGSVAIDKDDRLIVPSFVNDGGKVEIMWCHLEDKMWGSSRPVYYF